MPDLPVLYTQDHAALRTHIVEHFQYFGLSVADFETNDEAWRYISTGGKCGAAILDYYTGWGISGAELITKLANHGGGGDVLIILSGNDRKMVMESINGHLGALPMIQSTSEEYKRRVNAIQIFDSHNETHLAELYIAAKVLFPEETKELTRKDLIAYFGIKLRDDYDTVPYAEVKKIRTKYNLIIYPQEISDGQTQTEATRKLLHDFVTELSRQQKEREHGAGNPERI